ncbi:oxygenase MpaB family protein [Mumia sp. Pv 4-285]|uniref:oxygenase MpaB family protein n=1 Tax=Mumia qirimensis TaxID=3234852 RepID=UPI00351D07E0
MTQTLPPPPRGRDRLRRDAWQRVIAGLDPVQDHETISAVLARYEFPWDIQQALSFALFRTFAVPSIGVLLQETHEFTVRTQKRHDDTVLVLDAIIEDGLESQNGRAAVRRMNRMHGAYAISNDDMRYVLSTFVVTPVRWLADYGYRGLTAAEIEASTRSYQRIGALMGIKDIPASYAEFEKLLDAYEAAHFGYDHRSREVADATLELLCTYYPRPLRRAVEIFSRSVMDPHVREAFRYPDPPHLVVALSRGLLRLRGRVLRLAPPRVKASRPEDRGAVRTYLPGGYRVEDLGTHTDTAHV